ncbi:MAG: ATP synthase F1 subunit delta [Candidatus Avigastranaerophilus sp.]
MKTGEVKHIKTAKRYSNAIFKLALESGLLDKIYNDLIFIQQTISSNPQLKMFLLNPVISKEDKKDVISKIFSVHTDKIAYDFLYLLADNGRIDILNEVLNQFTKKYNEENNIIKPQIISAVELNEIQKDKLKEKLEKKLSKKVVPEYLINADIIGGLIVEIDDKTIDCSLKTKFYNMKQQLTKGSRYGSD